MSAQAFWLPNEALVKASVGDSLTLDGREGHHAVVVKRIGVGESIRLGDGAYQADCTVITVGAAQLIARIEAVRPVAKRLPKLALVQALAKGGRDEQALEAATELGVDQVIAWQAERSIVRWSAAKEAKALSQWQQAALTAAKQSRQAAAPTVSFAKNVATVLEQLGENVTVLVLHESATASFRDHVDHVRAAGTQTIAVVVGPEGGIAESELAAFRDAGALIVRLGQEVLRASNAGPSALAVLSFVLGRWDAEV